VDLENEFFLAKFSNHNHNDHDFALFERPWMVSIGSLSYSETMTSKFWFLWSNHWKGSRVGETDISGNGILR
jgi:hypothetical protein